VALAVKYFSAAAALPGALFSIWHNLSGSMLAGFWSRRPVFAPADLDQIGKRPDGFSR
jgi:BASS family bile acid:Na+ symporter